jgi:hypothetical protein
MLRFPAIIGLFFAVATADAAVFTVSNTNDSGAGSLRDAVAQANAAAGADAIEFGVTGTIVLTSGQIQISGPLAIVGPGAEKLTIDGNAADRIFAVYAIGPQCPAVDGPDYLVSISGLRLTNARKMQGNETAGAIFSGHSLALDFLVVDNNAAGNGGGLAFQIQYPGQTLTISHSHFVNNVAEPLVPNPAGPNYGGAVALYDRCSGATRTPAVVTIANSVFSGNRARPTDRSGMGGAIYSLSGADLTITDTRIVANHVEVPDPPLATSSYSGGGIWATAKSLRIERSEVAENTADFAAGLRLLNTDPDLQTPQLSMAVTIVNSTVSGNVAGATGGAMHVNGNVAVMLQNSTVSGNSAGPTRTGGMAFTTGATSPVSGSNALAPSLTVVSSIVADNSSDGGDVAAGAPAIAGFVINATDSLIERICPSPACEISVTGSNWLLGVDPMLGPLALNGGTSRTQALQGDSPAINAGSNPLNLATDQRGVGFPRSLHGSADMGAFERSPVSTGSTYSRNYVQKAYVAYYGRPADPAGLTYWATRMDREGQSLDAIIGAFGYSDEFNRRYGGLGYEALVTRIYQQALGRDPDPAGLNWYVTELMAGRRTLQTITLDVLNGATTPPDATVVAHKLAVAAYYTAKVAAGCIYGSELTGVTALTPVTADRVTVATAEVAIDGRCLPSPPPPPG